MQTLNTPERIDGRPRARFEVRNKAVVFEIRQNGKKFQRIRPKEIFKHQDRRTF